MATQGTQRPQRLGSSAPEAGKGEKIKARDENEDVFAYLDSA